jgi:hypothetical protein
LGDAGVNGKANVKMVHKGSGYCGADWVLLNQEDQMVGFFKNGNEHLETTTCSALIDQLSE